MKKSLYLGLCLSVATSTTLATEFSATLVRSVANKPVLTGALYVSDNGTRMEFNNEQGRHITIMKADYTYGIDVDKQQFFRLPTPPGASGPGKHLLPEDPQGPCASEELSCERLGNEAINGRETVKWQMTRQHQGKSVSTTAWIDAELRVPVRQVMPWGETSELRDIEIAPQPATLFEVPGNFREVKVNFPPPPQSGQ